MDLFLSRTRSNKARQGWTALLSALLVMLFGLSARETAAQATYRFRELPQYEDTVRVVVMWNSKAVGIEGDYLGLPACNPNTRPVGVITRDFVTTALSTMRNVKIIQSGDADWNRILALHGGKKPHVIVHVNAGWWEDDGNRLTAILNRAVDSLVGVVSIGDDAAFFADNVFGMLTGETAEQRRLVNEPPPMVDGRQYNKPNDRLWIDLTEKDTLAAPGVTRNTRDSLGKPQLFFKPADPSLTESRCQADADSYSLRPDFIPKIRPLGFQKAFDSQTGQTIGASNALQTVVAFNDGFRRGVALSFQPQFLADKQAANQIVYDAVVYASFAHRKGKPLPLNPPRIEPARATFPVSQTVTITHENAQAKIYYTLTPGTDTAAAARPTTGSTLYTGPITVGSNTIIKAIAFHPDWDTSGVAVGIYTKLAGNSTLTITDAAGNPLPVAGGVRYLSEKNASFTVTLNTTAFGITDARPVAVTRVKGDSENLILPNTAQDANSRTFRGTVPLSTNGSTQNGRVDANAYDWLVISWTNPQNPADIVRDSVRIRPALAQADMFFSATSGGPRLSGSYAGNESQIHIVVADQLPDPSRINDYEVVLTTTTSLVGHAADRVTAKLVALPGGNFGVSVPVDLVVTTNTGDNRLQLQTGDQISATFRDPVDGDQATANVGFGTPTQVAAKLVFTDSNYVPLAPGAFWYHPAAGKVYVEFTDDFAAGGPKTISFAIQNGGRAPADSESFALSNPVNAGGVGTWRGSFNLNDTPNPAVRNSVLETYIKGTIRAAVATQSANGTPDGGTARAELIVANQNQTAVLKGWDQDKGTDSVPTRFTKTLTVEIRDQSLTEGVVDTLSATLSCKSDNVQVQLIEVSPGIYQVKDVQKSEGAPTGGDRILSCAVEDILKISYTDPVYGDLVEKVYQWASPALLDLQFVAADSTTPLLTQQEEVPGRVLVKILATSPTRDQADQIEVTVTNNKGDEETFQARETGPATGIFFASIPYGFITVAPQTRNNLVESRLNPDSATNEMKVLASAGSPAASDQAEVTIFSGFIRAAQAYMLDGNGNGRADTAVFIFDRPLPRAPTALPQTFWNSVGNDNRRTAPRLSVHPARPSVVIADFSQDEFPVNLTSIPGGLGEAQRPHSLFPSDNLFGGQRVFLADSVGPVLVGAEKRVPKLVRNATGGFEAETLLVVVSEPIRPGQDMSQMVRFGSSPDYDQSQPVQALGTPIESDNGKQWKITVNPGSPTPNSGQYVFLSREAGITDLVGRAPGRKGVQLGVTDLPRPISSVRAHPPVVVDPKDPNFNLVNSQGRKQPGTGGYSQWIPPAGFNPLTYEQGRTWVQKPLVPGENPCPFSQTEVGFGRPENLPACLSAVQVISQGKYKAKISIFDNLGNFLRKQEQHFGYCGELGHDMRGITGGNVSYLVWDMKDEKGRKAGQGAYVWKITLETEKNSPIVETLITGIMRSSCLE